MAIKRTMDRINNDILLIICEFLLGSHYPSLLSFSSISKRHRFLSSALLFRDVFIKAISLDEIEQKLKICTETLRAADALRCVRRLRFEGEESRMGLLPWIWTLDGKCGAYKQLEILVRHLDGMFDLHMDIQLHNHRLLLDLLSAGQPQCRLHLGSVQLLSLHLDPVNRDPSESALVTSDRIYSVTARWNTFHSNGNPDYTLEAALEMVSGLAPNLKFLSLVHSQVVSSGALCRARRGTRKEWDGFLGLTKSGQRCVALEHLKVWEPQVQSMRLSGLVSLADLSTLRELTVGRVVSLDALGYLADMHLPALQSLCIGLEGEENTEYDTLATAFLQALAPLHSLKILSWYSLAIFEAVMERHGSTLRSLTMPAVWTREISHPTLQELNQMRSFCTSLESLTLTIRRSLGDRHEVAIYQALGSIPRLQWLTLTLDASNRALTRSDQEVAAGVLTPTPPTFDAFDLELIRDHGGTRVGYVTEVRKGHVRESLINSALDKALALQIYDTIAAAKPTGRLPLESLSVMTSGGGFFGNTLFVSHVMDVFSEVSRSWQISRNIRDDKRDELIVEESSGSDYDLQFVPPTLHRDMEPIFRKIWPRHPSSSDKDRGWRKDWQSIPLTKISAEESGA